MQVEHILEGLGVLVFLISVICLVLGIPQGQDIHQKEGRSCPEQDD
jgi:hypothetical protein